MRLMRNLDHAKPLSFVRRFEKYSQFTKKLLLFNKYFKIKNTRIKRSIVCQKSNRFGGFIRIIKVIKFSIKMNRNKCQTIVFNGLTFS